MKKAYAIKCHQNHENLINIDHYKLLNQAKSVFFREITGKLYLK